MSSSVPCAGPCGALPAALVWALDGKQGHRRQGRGPWTVPHALQPCDGMDDYLLPEYRDFYSRRLNVKGFDRKGVGCLSLTPTHHPVSSTYPALS